ncbi:lantibiotic dehydratase [Streptomyces albidoflavus]
MSQVSLFRATEFAILRLSLLPSDWPTPWSAETSMSGGNPRAALTAVDSDSIVSEAIGVSSLWLEAIIEKAASGSDLEPKRLRRATLSTNGYFSRMRYRATPFGLLAGVTPVHFADSAKVSLGISHRKYVRPDLEWLYAVIRPWELEEEVLRHLKLVSNDLCSTRGSRLVKPNSPVSNKIAKWRDSTQTVRHTSAVRTTMELTETPISYRQLITSVSSAYPQVNEGVVKKLVKDLVRHGFLLTDLLPPLTTDDPLGHVLEKLSKIEEHPGRSALIQIANGICDYAAIPIGQGRDKHRSLVTSMRQLHNSDRTLHVDMRMDAGVVLPRSVSIELEKAVSVAWTLTQDPSAGPLAGYRARFVEHYGANALVPVKELLDPHTGLGVPTSYLKADQEQPARNSTPLRARDTLLCDLAQQAAAHAQREVILDNELINQLVNTRGIAEPPSCIEACFHLLANSEEDLQAGEFRLVASLGGLAWPASMFGRFLHLLPELHEPVTGLAAAVTEESATVGAQVIGGAVPHRIQNIAQVPEMASAALHIGVFSERSRPETHTANDLLVGVDANGLAVFSAHTGKKVTPIPFHAVNPMWTSDVVRFLIDIGRGEVQLQSLWNWGVAQALPFLPRIRYGRTVLASAQWRPPPQIGDGRLERAQWANALDDWRARWAVPDTVRVMSAKGGLRLNLNSQDDLELLHAEFRKNPAAVLQEELCGGEVGTGWARNHATELVVPLRSSTAQSKNALPLAVSGKTRRKPSAPRVSYPPGGEWLYLKLYASEEWHGELLAQHLPVLLAQANPMIDRWFFVRYRDDQPHLRVRFHGDPAELNGRLLPAIHDWTENLCSSGLIRDIVLDTYWPETGRYGGREAIAAAEDAFYADTEAVIAQLALRDRGLLDLPLEILAAANHLDLAARLIPDDWRVWVLKNLSTNGNNAALRHYRERAIQVLDPLNGWQKLTRLPGGQQLLRIWERRAPRLISYGRALRDLAVGGHEKEASHGIASILHMHHNRLIGVQRDAENLSYAIARTILRSQSSSARGGIE